MTQDQRLLDSPGESREFEALLEFVKSSRGFDFTVYKRPSLQRRVRRRMQDLHLASYVEYRARLEEDEGEFADLFNTILINVTGFFRDPATWKFIERECLPRLLEERQAGDHIRVWSTGCATGEEAYTLAILLAEALGEDAFRQRVKVYATDVDNEALTVGRTGAYTSKQVDAVREEFRLKYFERTDSRFSFRADLRRSVIFGRHDLVQDPPISRIDLLVSRNTLMYFTAAAQRKILDNFRFALRDDGLLFLGRSEMLVTRLTSFAPVDLKHRVFAKIPRQAMTRELAARDGRRSAWSGGDAAVHALVADAAFDTGAVPQIVIDREGRLVLANAQARALAGLRPQDVGRPLKDLELSYRPVDLRSRMDQVYAERQTVSIRDVDWPTATAEPRYIDVQIVPLATAGEVAGLAISFTDVTRYRRLQDALRDAKRDAEVAYEELNTTVEELETTNEELQSTNEELETTNEELQSTNEELETMNDEIRQRTDLLADTNLFVEAVLASLEPGVVVVDRQLLIEAWNPAARELWGVGDDEVVGTSLAALDIGLPVERLVEPARRVLASESESMELVLDATNRRGRSIRCRVRVAALQTLEGRIRGAILLMEEAKAARGAG